MLNSSNGARGLIPFLIGFINNVIVFILAATVLVFIWGIFRLVFSGKDSKEREAAKGYILWGIIALAVMVSVWGLVNLLISFFGFGATGSMVPQFPNPVLF
jgi:fumarate reductase subunit D